MFNIGRKIGASGEIGDARRIEPGGYFTRNRGVAGGAEKFKRNLG